MPRFLTAITICALSCVATAAIPSESPNPAAIFCVEQGGSYTVVDGADGQRGMCRLYRWQRGGCLGILSGATKRGPTTRHRSRCGRPYLDGGTDPDHGR